MHPRPRLLIVSISRLTSDPRVMKQVRLLRSDYDITTCGIGPAPEGVVEHLAIADTAQGWVDDRVALVSRQYHRAYDGIEGVAAARKLLSGRTFDVVLANEINTVPLALEVKARFGVHADLHEFNPREKDDVLTWRLFVAPFMRWLCRNYLPRVASATTVSQGIAEAYERDYGLRCEVVTNAAPFIDRKPTRVGDPIRLFHSAAGQRYRKIERLLEAMRGTQNSVHLTLILMPHEPDYVAEITAMAADIPNVTLHDPVPYEQLVRTVAEHDAAIAFLPPSNFNLANALPNKFFEAVQARVGLIIGPTPEMARIVSQYSLGVITRDFSVASLRDTIDAVTPEAVARWKDAADAAARELSAEAQSLPWKVALDALVR